jgi:hypothetical protein
LFFLRQRFGKASKLRERRVSRSRRGPAKETKTSVAGADTENKELAEV